MSRCLTTIGTHASAGTCEWSGPLITAQRDTLTAARCERIFTDTMSGAKGETPLSAWPWSPSRAPWN